MSMRIFSASSLLLIAGCGAPVPAGPPLANTAAAVDTADGSPAVACAPAGTPALEPVCALERTTGEQGLILTLRNPDGGFHRLRVTRDGRGVVAADGAQAAVVSIVDKSAIEVVIGGDRYRLPATIGAVTGAGK